MKVTFKGNIGRDAQLRKFGEGENDFVCSFPVGEHIKTASGTKTVWRTVTIWRSYAKAMAPWLTKGRKVFIEGKVTDKVDIYTRNNTTTATIVVYADDIDLLDKPEQDDAAPEGTPVTPDDLPFDPDQP